MIDERVFGMPHVGDGYVDYLVSHEICHQWWYNLIGTNGYCETWMDEAMATYFAHQFLDQKYGHNNMMLRYPRGLEWLPNIRRETYRYYSMYGVIGRGEQGPIVQEMPKFGHIANLFGMCYDKGSKHRRHDRGAPRPRRLPRLHAAACTTATTTASSAWPTFSASWRRSPASRGTSSSSAGCTASA